MGKNTARKTAFSGLMLSLSIIILYAQTLLPTGRFALYVLSSFIVSVVVLELGIKPGWGFYLASSILSIILIPNKVGMVLYILFFGLYPLVKLYIERIRNIILEYILKYAFLNISVVVTLYLIKSLFEIIPVIRITLWIVIIGLQLVFLLYDYVFTKFIWYYRSRFRSQ